MKIIEIISGIKCNILNEATIKHFAHIGLNPNNSYHAELVDAYNMGVSSRDPDVPKNANQIKSLEQLEKVVGKHLEKIHDKQLEKLLVYDNPKTGIKVFKVLSARQCRTVASDTHWCVVSKEKGDYHFKDYDPSGNYSYVIWTPEPNLEKIGIIGITPFTESKYYAQQFVNQNNAPITDDQWLMLRKKYNLHEVKSLEGIRGIPLSHKRTEELVKEAEQDPKLAVEYAQIIGKRFPLGEPAIAKSAKYSVAYARIIGRFPAGEPEIAKDSFASLQYSEVINGEFPAGEPAIAKNAEYSFKYAQIIGKRFPLGEPAIATSLYYSFEYADKIGDPDPDTWQERYTRGNPLVYANDPHLAIEYAKMIGGRFPEGEPAIAKSADYSLEYAKIIKGRFPAGEPEIAKYPFFSLEYAEIIGRFPAGEPEIAKDPEYSEEYAGIIDDPDPETWRERYLKGEIK